MVLERWPDHMDLRAVQYRRRPQLVEVDLQAARAETGDQGCHDQCPEDLRAPTYEQQADDEQQPGIAETRQPLPGLLRQDRLREGVHGVKTTVVTARRERKDDPEADHEQGRPEQLADAGGAAPDHAFARIVQRRAEVVEAWDPHHVQSPPVECSTATSVAGP